MFHPCTDPLSSSGAIIWSSGTPAYYPPIFSLIGPLGPEKIAKNGQKAALISLNSTRSLNVPAEVY